MWEPGGSSTLGSRDQSNELPYFVIALLRAFHEAGAPLVVGTDSDGTYVAHGYSIHQELFNFLSAGYSPYEALRASTADAAELLGKQSEFGMVAPGKLANLVLLQDNPLSDIRATERRIGVVVRGDWYWQQELEALVESYDLVQK